MRILLWHVHGSWTTSFVQGRHTYLLPTTPDRGEDGRGRARTWEWPASAVEVAAEDLAREPVDVVVLQRPHELELAARWLGRRLGRDVPAVYLEHNTPIGVAPGVPDARHPLADQDEIPIVHVTGFNDLFWDCGRAPTTVIEHGIVDPGPRYTGEIPRAAVVVNDPVRRGRSVGADLLRPLAEGLAQVGSGLDVFGMRVSELPPTTGLATFEDLPQARMHTELARRAVYVHPCRWTSLGLSLLEARLLGMPVVALGTTETPVAVPPGTGLVTTRREELLAGVRRLLTDRDDATRLGAAGRAHALARYGLGRFLADWDALLERIVGAAGSHRSGTGQSGTGQSEPYRSRV